MITQANVVTEFGHLLMTPEVRAEFEKVLTDLGLKHLHTTSVDSRYFISAKPSLYTRETRFVFRDTKTAMLLVWVMEEILNDPEENGHAAEEYDVVFSLNMTLNQWMPLRSPVELTPSQRERIHHLAENVDGTWFAISTAQPALIDDVFTNTVSLKVTHPGVGLPIAALHSLTQFMVAAMQPLAGEKFHIVNITGLAPQAWNQNAKHFFWAHFPLSELKGMATHMLGDDIPFTPEK